MKTKQIETDCTEKGDTAVQGCLVPKAGCRHGDGRNHLYWLKVPGRSWESRGNLKGETLQRENLRRIHVLSMSCPPQLTAQRGAGRDLVKRCLLI